MRPPAVQTGALAHVPALDGLRGLAVLGVLAFHAGALRGGFLGVDLFFVLSGYLITALLLAEHATAGRIDLRAFWVRRARRLLPALLALMPAIALYAAIFARPRELAAVRRDALATLGYVSNWASIVAGRSYWSLFTAPSPLEHTWSLAIEEQFYLAWPLLLRFAMRGAARPARRTLALAAGLGAVSAASLWLRWNPLDGSRAYLGTDTRGAAILAGCALAAVLHDGEGARPFRARARRRAGTVGALAAMVLAAAWTFADGERALLYRGGFWATEACVVALLVAALRAPKSAVARALAWGPLRSVGAVSYGVYLWHWPLFVVLTPARTGLDGLALAGLRVGLTFAAAAASYRWIEQPVRREGFPTKHPAVLVAAAMVAAAAAVMFATRGAPTASTQSAGWPAAPRGAKRVLVLGDSVATSLGEVLAGIAAEGPLSVAVRGVEDCSILESRYRTLSLSRFPHVGGSCDRRWAEQVAALRPDVTVVLLGGGFFAPAQIDGGWRSACDPRWDAAFRERLVADLRTLDAYSPHIVLATAPYPAGIWAGVEWVPRVACYQRVLREAAAAVPGVVVADLAAVACPAPGCDRDPRYARLRDDGLHYAAPGALPVARWLLPLLR